MIQNTFRPLVRPVTSMQLLNAEHDLWYRNFAILRFYLNIMLVISVKMVWHVVQISGAIILVFSRQKLW